MKKLKMSSVNLAWLARAKSAMAVAPTQVRAMHDRLDLVLPRGWPESGSPVFWRWLRRGEQPQSGQANDLRQLPEAARRARAYIWTPAADTVLTSATLPTRSRRKITQALPFALEDRLLGDPETLHFAYRNETDGSLSVAVTGQERLRHWADSLAQVDIKPDVLCPATLLVPWALDCWSLLFSADEILVRTGGASGFITPLSSPTAKDGGSMENAGGLLPPPLLVASLQEAARAQKSPESLVVFNAPAGFPAEAWSAQLQVQLRVEKASIWDKQGEPVASLNLLQGQFEQKGQIGQALRPYLPAAAMLLVWLVGNVGVNLSDWWKLRQQHNEYTREMTTLLLSSFPETKTVLDPAAQMQRSIDTLLARTGKRDRDLLPMLYKTSAVLRADKRVRLRGLRYADHSLTLELTWPTPSTPDAIRAALEAAGLHAEVLSVTPRAGEVDGRVRLQPAAPRTTTRTSS
jgi:general secretion pathway protein L